jgi:hypothetical protein
MMGDTFALMRTPPEPPGPPRDYRRRRPRRARDGRGANELRPRPDRSRAAPAGPPQRRPRARRSVRTELQRHDVNILCDTHVNAVEKTLQGSPHPHEVQTTDPDERPVRLPGDVVLVSVGVRPTTELAQTWRRLADSLKPTVAWKVARRGNDARHGRDKAKTNKSGDANVPIPPHQSHGLAPPLPRRGARWAGGRRFCVEVGRWRLLPVGRRVRQALTGLFCASQRRQGARSVRYRAARR